MVVCRHETIRRWFYHEDITFKNGIIILIKKDIRNLIHPYHHVRTQQEALTGDSGKTDRTWVSILQKYKAINVCFLEITEFIVFCWSSLNRLGHLY